MNLQQHLQLSPQSISDTGVIESSFKLTAHTLHKLHYCIIWHLPVLTRRASLCQNHLSPGLEYLLEISLLGAETSVMVNFYLLRKIRLYFH